jgi:tRNA wybutosine-synthesizing protein 3
MAKVSFERRKADCLSKDDKSSIGEWDEPIKKLCERINKKKEYYTLSSCSGRHVLIKNIDKKQPDMFVLREHGKISFEQLKNALDNYIKNKGKEGLLFKQEGVILHVCCKTLEDAEKMLNLARECGWKNSGVMSLGQDKGNRIVLELRSTENLALPIVERGRVLVDDDFLRVLVRESNTRLEKTWEKIGKLEKKL